MEPLSQCRPKGAKAEIMRTLVYSKHGAPLELGKHAIRWQLPNQRAAGKGGITSMFQVGSGWSALPEHER
jgi:hypothetical protein